MRFRDFFSRFSPRRAGLALAATFSLAAAGGFTGAQVAHRMRHPEESAFALNQLPQGLSLKAYQASSTQAPEEKKRYFTEIIILLAQEKKEMERERLDIEQAVMRAPDVVVPTDIQEVLSRRQRALEARHREFLENVTQVLDEMRENRDLSEKQYEDLLSDYMAWVGATPSKEAGNYKEGAMYLQECQMQFRSAMEIGDCMQVSRHGYGKTEALAAGAGAGAGRLLSLPFWLRIRKREKKEKGPGA